MELPSSYDPKQTEEKWYRLWEEGNYFHAREDDGKEPYCIVIPPPNVTGTLHIGHALNNTLQDILIRWQRMMGKSALWMPGMDHAGIATQNVVERLLKEEGKTKDDLGREAFEKRVWQWKEHSGGQIQNQLRRLGCSCDWERERFTLDKGLSRAVHTVFASLYQEGLIYQGYRIINWCPRCETALSDIETEYQELEGHLWHIKYPMAGSKDFIVVATTRPETMLGDTGVAVNPDDERYKDMVGKMVVLPLMNREIPIFADHFVDREFGTGLVKVTPAHDPNDFEMGKRHGLEEINILDKNGFINENGGPYRGLSRFDARKKVVEDLEKLGLLVKIEKHMHAVGHCYRCRTIIEPYLSKQWFVKIKPLADAGIQAVEDGLIRFVPKSWEKTYFEWMRNIRDWCISRQLWWGHRIPAFYCDDCGHITVQVEDPTECEKCKSKNIRQDEDVLDTWFSSGLWPFSTLGWPDRTPALDKYYPTSVLVTAFDIIFFWVARMIMMGLKFMGDVPFRDVYIHALIRDEHGAKMSKSRGNVIDPIVMMDQYGTDALRFTLAMLAAQGRDIILSEKRIEGYRTFCNKIWNATRFIMMNLGEGFTAREPVPAELEVFDRWILHRLNEAIREVQRGFEEYKFNDAAHAVYSFWWHEFCDWYIELTKQRLYDKEGGSQKSSDAARQVLFHVLKKSMQLMHPFMPFITEEIWDKIKDEKDGLILVSQWPAPRPEFDFVAESEETRLFQEIVYWIRNIRGEMNVPPDRKASVVFKTASDMIATIIKREGVHIRALAKVDTITMDPAYAPSGTDASAVMNDIEIFMPLKGLIDFDKERARIDKEIARVRGDLDRVEKKLANENFTGKAPAEVIENEKTKRAEFAELLQKLEQSRAKFN
ncbi:MAG TPA: valine--tRNA ligase [Spirochaetota bacterium]|nr:valine--tRNA ligase [Spirochaetota bacterium]HPC42631.1 valine--tRNA ligase [Spirochaetota bacterium]HQF08449.1 valine--tRNA ligase [Spirochaetota bacterium]HQH99087.1 valine--tRNA ligase [Spirochaetota bacterium]HQJ72438.1 valine--tRNA ligase [Spirochaetota bacterium]